MAKDRATAGLDAAYGEAPTDDRRTTGDPAAPPAAATDTLNALQTAEADARTRQADREATGDDDEQASRRRERAYAIWEREGRPDGRHDDHWHAAGEDDVPEPGTTPWTEGP